MEEFLVPYRTVNDEVRAKRVLAVNYNDARRKVRALKPDIKYVIIYPIAIVDKEIDEGVLE